MRYWWKVTGFAAAFALQVVEFGHMMHECAPVGADRARCDALPGLHSEDGPGGWVQLGPEIKVVAGVTGTVALTGRASFAAQGRGLVRLA
jgi:hypothetical protein